MIFRCCFSSFSQISSSAQNTSRLFVAALLGLLIFAPTASQAQSNQPPQAQNWQVHTSLREVVDITTSPDAIWTATTGGIFRYGITSGEISRFTTTEGLLGLNIRSIAYDAVNQAVWVGYQDGILDRINVETSTIQSFLDIQRATQFPQRDIRNMEITGDTLIVATGFGIVLFDVTAGETRESYINFGNNEPASRVNDITISSAPDGVKRLWVAQTGSVASAPLNAPNLQDPSAWTSTEIGGGTLEINSIAGFGNTIYAGSESGLFVRNNDGTFSDINVTNNSVNLLLPGASVLLGMESTRLLAVESPTSARTVGAGTLRDLQTIAYGPDGNLWIGDLFEGLLAAAPVTASTSAISVVREPFFPDGPFDGQFSQLTFDQNNNLWLGGVPGSEKGFYKFATDKQWTSYIKRFYTELQGRPTSFQTIHTDSQDNVWVGSVGGGVLQLSAEEEFTFFDDDNSTLTEAIAAPGTGFVIVRGISSEPDGTLWVANTGGARPLHARLLDGTWYDFSSKVGNSVTYERIFVDSFRQKWIVTIPQNNLQKRDGLLVLDTGSSLEDTGDDAFRHFNQVGSSGQGLPGLEINGIDEDKSGRLWVATNEGLAYFINTGIVAQDPNSVAIWPLRASRQPGESQYLFFGLYINDVVVDPANNLWVATNAGAWYVEEAEFGFQITNQLTAENSPLLSNTVLSIKVNEVTGEVFFSTDLGLISMQGDATAPASEKQDLNVYPNPFDLSKTTSPEVVIDGLLDDTDVTIVTASGNLVKNIKARGGRVRWDGRDFNNNLVPSGMYIVIAVDQDGDGTAYGKVAVIN